MVCRAAAPATLALPITLPIPANRMRKRQPECAIGKPAIVDAAVIF